MSRVFISSSSSSSRGESIHHRAPRHSHTHTTANTPIPTIPIDAILVHLARPSRRNIAPIALPNRQLRNQTPTVQSIPTHHRQRRRPIVLTTILIPAPPTLPDVDFLTATTRMPAPETIAMHAYDLQQGTSACFSCVARAHTLARKNRGLH